VEDRRLAKLAACKLQFTTNAVRVRAGSQLLMARIKGKGEKTVARKK
jgi:hypothetical protein